jgi:hypothetical protein
MTPTISIIDTKALYEYLQKQYENRRLIKFIEIGSTFFLISFFLLFAVRPTALVISALVGEIKSKEILSEKMKNKIDQVIMAQDSFSQVQENYTLIEDSLPSRPNYSSVADILNGSAQQSQLVNNSISFDLIQKNTDKGRAIGFETYTANPVVGGSFSSITAYIDKLLHSRRVMDIKTITLSNHKSDSTTQKAAPGQIIDIGIAPIIYYWSGGSASE